MIEVAYDKRFAQQLALHLEGAGVVCRVSGGALWGGVVSRTRIGGLARKTFPALRYVSITDVFADLDAVKARLTDLRAWRSPPTLDVDGLLIHQAIFGVLAFDGFHDWTWTPPPTCLNLNLSAPLPTLESL